MSDLQNPSWQGLLLRVGLCLRFEPGLEPGRARQPESGITQELAPVHSGFTRPFCTAYITSSAVLCTPSAPMMRAR